MSQLHSSLAGRHILVTGAGGFIGRHVIQALVEAGVFARAHLGPDDDTTAVQAMQLPYLQSDIASLAEHSGIWEGVDTVIHLAGPASVARSFEAPREYLRAHTEGTCAVLEACRARRISRLVYVSSAEIYGLTPPEPVSESRPPAARSPYAAAKVGAEQLIHAAQVAWGLNAVIVRPFSVYGPGMAPTSLLGRIAQQLHTGEPVRLADLRPVRDYVYVADVAEALLRACALEVPAGSILNLGSGRGYSVQALAALTLEVLDKSLELQEIPLLRRPGNADLLYLVANPDAALKVLGWSARVSLAQGLVRTFQSMEAVQ